MPGGHAIIRHMILVTGGTGFVGRALIRHLVESGYRVRTLVRPSQTSPRLPKGIGVEVAVTSLNDARGLRAAMVGVETIYHLAGVERRGAGADLLTVDVRGTQNLLQAARDAGVQRVFYLSHLGAARSSAYPVFKAKAIAEQTIRRSGLSYTIFRAAILFGPGDGFTTGLAQLLAAQPFITLIPGHGDMLLQPLWIEDLVTCMAWAMEEPATREQTYEVGGPEFLSLNDIILILKQKLGLRRRPVSIAPPLLRALTVTLEYFLPYSPVSSFWLDYLAENRTCSLDTLPRVFQLIPARFAQRLDYLQDTNWALEFWRNVFRRNKRYGN